MTKPFTIPELRMPTLEEHRAASAKWLARVHPCLYEHWPEALKALSFHTEIVELMEENRQAIWDAMDGKESPAIPAFLDKLDQQIAAYTDAGCFVKLSSRSPKDWWPEEGPQPFRTGAEVLGVMSESVRIADDLIEYQYADTPCYLLLREYHAIPKQEEWRCFIREGKVIGITQYHYRDHFPELVTGQADIAAAIHGFLEAEVLPILHVDTVVVDVWIREKPLVIEINPYGLSDPCLFNYQELETADGELRVVEANASVET